MANYGTVIDEEIETDAILDYFDQYFNNPTLYKIRDIEDQYSLYMVKIYCMLNNKCRYIVVIIPFDTNPVNFPIQLQGLKWLSLQTRELSENHKIRSHSYQPSNFPFLNKKIERIEQLESYSIYVCKEYDLKIKLLHTKGMNEYQNKGTLITALETYQTVITRGIEEF